MRLVLLGSVALVGILGSTFAHGGTAPVPDPVAGARFTADAFVAPGDWRHGSLIPLRGRVRLAGSRIATAVAGAAATRTCANRSKETWQNVGDSDTAETGPLPRIPLKGVAITHPGSLGRPVSPCMAR